ncbi:hypothetical protein [Sulfuricystis thermophila]|uniref:hypothetical protein n=1 Tax=Sulfuricystis thermophila TaxID=2496847 RepID=UPI001036E3AA|nr:hypothetical protein [Sulfuricystis thermophila]
MELTLREQRLLVAFRERSAGTQKVIEDVAVHMMGHNRRVAAKNDLIALDAAATKRKLGSRALPCQVREASWQ